MSLIGQVGVVTKNPGWYGRMVQWFTHSDAFHTVTFVGDVNNDGIDMVVSAETPKVILRPASDFPDAEYTAVVFDTIAKRNDAVRFVLRQVGKPYAYFDILLLWIAMWLRERTPWFIKNRLTDEGQWYCAELSDAGMEAGGVNLFPRMPPCAVIPKDWLTVIRTPMRSLTHDITGDTPPDQIIATR